MRRGSAAAGEGQKRDDVEGVEDDVGSAAVDGKTQAIPEAVSQLSHHVQLPRRLIFILFPLPPRLSAQPPTQLGLAMLLAAPIMIMIVQPVRCFNHIIQMYISYTAVPTQIKGHNLSPGTSFRATS